MSVAIVIAYYPTLNLELAMGGAALVMLLGAWLCWGAPRYRMSIEERLKDGKMTEAMWKDTITTLVESGQIDKPLDAKEGLLWTNELIGNPTLP